VSKTRIGRMWATLTTPPHAPEAPDRRIGAAQRYRPLEWPHADQSVLGVVGLASPSAAQIAIANIPPSWYTGPPAGGVTEVGW
jgi:hypothetical protein